MHRSLWWLLIGLTILAGAGVMAWRNRASPARVPLGDGSELRVLKVSLGTNHVFSTEPIWKQCLRRVLPRALQGPLGSFQGQRFLTRYDSLVVWVDRFKASSGEVGAGSFEQPEALFAHGSVVKGRVQRLQTGAACLEFPSFARDARRVPLRVHDGSNVVAFAVDNPRPIQAARWTARPVPQTNQSLGAEIVLRNLRLESRQDAGGTFFQSHLYARGLGEARAGWMAWRLTAFDPLGNWTESNWTYSGSRLSGVLLLPPGDSTWKLLVEAQEYISAGFVSLPIPSTCRVLAPSRRAHDVGVRRLMVVGPGSYRIIDGVRADSLDNSEIAGRPSLDFSSVSGGTKTVLALTSPVPGILVISDADSESPLLRARLRDRLEGDGGRIFRPSGFVAATNSVNGVKQIARFFSPRLPTMATNLELEIIATLPPAEFLVSPPKR
ncbi:MAG TPA: hypothetical protein VJW76_04785 [Verrucomicrobiae bacterium]|nr:hypothetical protein [Verrucomicrobiae bacterium]